MLMFGASSAFSSFSVNDIGAAHSFYSSVLGLEVVAQGYALEVHVPGAGGIMLYPKEDHQPATFTVLNFRVPELEPVVAALKEQGVRFETYDLPGIKTDDNHIFHDKEMPLKIAWFTDPAGNILSVLEAQGGH